MAETKSGLWAGVGRYHVLVFLGCWLGGIFDGLDSNLFSIMLPNAIQTLCHTTDKAVISHMGSIITAVFLIGWMLGGVIFGVVGDKLGRVKAMVLSILLYALFTGAAGFAHSAWQLGLFRFLTGLGIGGELVSITTLLSETWPERSRAIIVGALLTSYQTGVLLSGGLTTVVSAWRMVFILGALPAILTIFIQTKLHEPKKWEAHNTPHVSPLALLKEVVAPGNRLNLFVGSLTFGGLLIGYWASLAWIPTWIFDLIGAHATNEKSIAVLFHGLAAVIGCILAGPLANRIGRRPTIMFSFAGAFAASLLLFLTNKVFSPIIYWEDALLGFFIGMAQAVMYIYLPELFRTRIRATGVGLCLNVGRLLSAVAALNVGVMVKALGGYAPAAMFFGCSYIIGLFAVLLGKETCHQEALPD